MRTQVLIDADGCPVVDEAVRLARRFGAPCVIFCDTSHAFDRAGAETVVVSKGADSADFALVNRAQRGDVAVTQDYGLAAMCLAKGALPVSQDGLVYSDQNIGALLQSRHAAGKLRRAGGRLRGPKKRTQAQDEAFVRALTVLLEDAARRETAETAGAEREKSEEQEIRRDGRDSD